MEHNIDKNITYVEMQKDDGTYTVIENEPLYYTTKYVAEQLEENDSTIRFWCDEFEDYLKIKRSGRNRMFTDKDIKKLQSIKCLLKSEKLSIRQAKEFLLTGNSIAIKPKIEQNDPLVVQAICEIIISQFDSRFKNIQDNILEKIKNEMVLNKNMFENLVEDLDLKLELRNDLMLKNQEELKHKLDFNADIQNQGLISISNQNEALKKEIASTIEDSMEKHSMKTEIMNEKLTDMEKEILKRDIEVIGFIDTFREQQRKKELEETEKQNSKKAPSKGFFKKLLGI
jgi:DNA-binding transcriptional MerR regulator